MKIGLTFTLMWLTLGYVFAQSASSAADSLVYENSKVLAFKKGSLYRSYPVYFGYPRIAHDNGIGGIMSFTCSLNEKCDVVEVEYQNSLGAVFEESIEKTLPSISKIFKAYKYQNCEQIKIQQELNFIVQNK